MSSLSELCPLEHQSQTRKSQNFKHGNIPHISYIHGNMYMCPANLTMVTVYYIHNNMEQRIESQVGMWYLAIGFYVDVVP